MARGKSTTKHDVALAEVHRKASREVIVARGVVFALSVAAFALPILALKGLVDPLAGKTTTVNFNLVLGATVVISITLNIFQFAKGGSRKRSLRRQRDEITELEEMDE